MKTLKGLNLTIDIDELRPILEKEGYELVKKESPPQFKVGDWVIKDESGDIFRVVGIKGDGSLGYPMQLWDNDGTYGYAENWRLAKSEEIESHLRKIADEKGFKEGVKSYHPFWNHTGTLNDAKDGYHSDFDIFHRGDVGIYRQGVWAEIVEEKKKLPRTKEELVTTLTEYFGDWNIKRHPNYNNFLEQYED